MELDKLLKSKALYSEIYDELSALVGGDLKTVIGEHNGDDYDYLIAGGCIANIIYSKVYKTNPPIRDIDVFLFKKRGSTKPNPDFLFSQQAVGFMGEYAEDNHYGFSSDLQTTTDGYSNSYSTPNGDSIKMISTRRVGVINFIVMDISITEYSENNENKLILDCFDINCCSAGLDVYKKELVYTPEFLKFIRGRQLEVVNPHNALQTTLRLIRKEKDLFGSYCDLGNEIKLLQHAWLTRNLKNSTIISEETYTKYLEHKETIDKHFQIKPLEKYLVSELNLDKDTEYWFYKPIISSWDLLSFCYNTQEVLGLWRMVETKTPKKVRNNFKKLVNFVKNNGIVTQVSFADYFYNLDYDDTISESLLDQNISYYNNFIFIKSLINKDYLNCDISDKHIKILNTFLNNHSRMSRLLSTNNNLIEDYQIVKTIKSTSNKHGEWIVGELESLPTNKAKEFMNSQNHRLWLEEHIKKVNEVNSKNLVNPIDLSGFKFKNNVTELLSTLDLRKEGVKMGHCVGGYSYKVGNYMSRIFSIESGGISSTVEIGCSYYSDNFVESLPEGINEADYISYEDKNKVMNINRMLSVKLEVLQHHGRYPEKGNLKPTDENIEIVKSLVDYINDKSDEVLYPGLISVKYSLLKDMRDSVNNHNRNKKTEQVYEEVFK